MSEKWGISRVGKLELEVGETLQEAIIRLQILPLPPLAWTDCFLQTVRGHEVTIIGTETHPDKIEAVARPAEVEDVLGKIDSAIENANEYVERVVRPRRKPRTVTLRVLKPTRGRDYRPSLTSSRKSSPNPNTPKTRVPTESHLLRRSAGEGVRPYGSTDAPSRSFVVTHAGAPDFGSATAARVRACAHFRRLRRCAAQHGIGDAGRRSPDTDPVAHTALTNVCGRHNARADRIGQNHPHRPRARLAAATVVAMQTISG